MRHRELMTLGSFLVVLGIVLDGGRLAGYSLIGSGILLSIASALGRSKKWNHKSGVVLDG